MSLGIESTSATSVGLRWLAATLGALGIFGGGCSGERPCEDTLTCSGAAARGGEAGAEDHGGSSGKGAKAGSGGSAGGGSSGKGAGGSDSGGGAGDAGAAGDVGDAGSTSGGGGGENSPPRVLSVTPADGSTGVEPLAAIELEFSEALEGDTVSAASLKLFDGSSEVAGAVAYEGTTATFTPTERLSLLAPYRVEVSATVSDLQGVELVSAFSSTFSVRDGAWSEPFELAGGTDVLRPIVGSDRNGNVLVTWSAGNDIHARWYRPKTGWESPEICAGCRSSIEPTSSVNAAGDAVIAFRSEALTQARQFRNGDWEASPIEVGTNCYFDSVTAVKMDPTGVAHIVCATGSNGEFTPFHTDEDGDWVGGLAWSTEFQEHVFPLALDFDAKGNGMAVWRRGEEGIGYARYNQAQEQWGAAATIADTDGGQIPLVAVGEGSDDFMALFWDDDVVKGSRFTAAQGWSDPETLGSGGASKALVASGDGFVAAWTQSPSSTANVYSARFRDGAWGQPELRSDGISSTDNTYPLSITSDSHGNLLLVWRIQVGSWSRLTHSRYIESSDTWTAPDTALEPDTAYFYPGESLSGAANGMAALATIAGVDPQDSVRAWVSFFE